MLPMGKGRIIMRAELVPRKSSDTSLGTRLAASCEAAAEIEGTNDDIAVTVADARFMKPLDIDLVRSSFRERRPHREGSVSARLLVVLHFLALEGAFDDGKLKFRPMVLPDSHRDGAVPAVRPGGPQRATVARCSSADRATVLLSRSLSFVFRRAPRPIRYAYRTRLRRAGHLGGAVLASAGTAGGCGLCRSWPSCAPRRCGAQFRRVALSPRA